MCILPSNLGKKKQCNEDLLQSFKLREVKRANLVIHEIQQIHYIHVLNQGYLILGFIG